MKYHNKNILCLEYDEYIDCFSIEIYKSDKKRGKLTTYGVGGNGRQVLIDYEALPTDRKQTIKIKYGNPYEYIAKQPLAEYAKINWDWEAERFYNDYVLPNRTRLPEVNVEKYTKSATWIKAIQYFINDRRALKQELNISIEAFWNIACDLIRTHEVSLPTTPRKLKDKLTDFKTEGYSLLVEAWRFGNSNSKKVNDKVSESLLIQMIAHPHKHDDTIIAIKYNEWAEKNGYEAITPGTVAYRRKQNAILTTLTRDGSGINYNQFSKRIQRERPSAPLLLINSDDNVLDLYFKEDNGKSKSDFYRATAYVVLDAFNDNILGYAIGEEVTIDLIKAAYRNAIEYVKQTTGDNYLWHQIQTDHWAIDKDKTGPLASFFKAQAHFTPAAVRVAQGKYIERSFGTTWHQQLKMFPNYAGYNVTAKEKRNPDAIQLAKKDYPSKELAPKYVAQFIENMRQTVNPSSGLPREQEWIEAVKASEFSRKRQISTEKRLQLFGVTHPHQNKITAAGIQVEINRKRLTFEVPNELYIDNINKTVQVTYDPYDMSQALISDGKGLRFVASQFKKMPSALADFKEGDMHRLNQLLDFKKQINSHVINSLEERKKTLTRAGVDANSILQAGITVKEIAHKAQKQVGGYLPDETGDEVEIFDWRQQL